MTSEHYPSPPEKQSPDQAPSWMQSQRVLRQATDEPNPNARAAGKEFASEQCTDFERAIARQQADMYETAVLQLMRRSGDNPELVNSLAGFVRVLTNRSYFGEDDMPLRAGMQTDLIAFLQDATNRLDGRSAQGQSTGWTIVRPGDGPEYS